MAIRVVPHGAEQRARVEAFNARMRAGGSPLGFYVDPEPRWIPKRDGQSAWRELWLAVEDDGAVIGAFALKPQRWLVHGRELLVADWQGPFSLGAVDARYAALGLRLIREMSRLQPLLYSWGHGGNEEPMVRMLRKMGWLMYETPFLFRVCDPFAFLRRNAYLRQEPAKALAQDALAFSGLGVIGLHAMHAALRARSLRRFRARGEIVPSFGSWADEVWARASGRYDAIALRDARAMNALVPSRHATDEWPPPARLRIEAGGETLGWAVVVERRLQGDARFGDLRVGMIADYLALPEHAGEVVHAAFDHLREAGVELVVANQAHPAWVAGFREAGFVAVADRRIFCASPQLESALGPFDQIRRGLFLSNMDGHGPIL